MGTVGLGLHVADVITMSMVSLYPLQNIVDNNIIILIFYSLVPCRPAFLGRSFFSSFFNIGRATPLRPAWLAAGNLFGPSKKACKQRGKNEPRGLRASLRTALNDDRTMK